EYVPPSRQPVSPAFSVSTSFCTVANGAEAVPALASFPDAAAYLVQDAAAACAFVAPSATSNVAAAKRRPTGRTTPSNRWRLECMVPPTRRCKERGGWASTLVARREATHLAEGHRPSG